MRIKKASMFCIVITVVIAMQSCEPNDWILNPPYIHSFYVENNSNKDVTIHKEWFGDEVWRVGNSPVTVEKGTQVTLEKYFSSPVREDNLPSILLCVSDTYRAERYRFVVDGETVREWNRSDIGKDIPHHFYDDDSWTLNKYQKEGNTYYTYYDWTYTITDDDLTLEQ